MTVTLEEGKRHLFFEADCSVRPAGRYDRDLRSSRVSAISYVLVVADHRDPSSIPSSSDIFKAAYNTISPQLKLKGMIVRSVADIPSARKMSGKIERNMDLAVEVARNSSARISTVLGVMISISMHRRNKGNRFFV
tara:strand:- start:862 stop:1269 length:408 start_codon:yes stop_codon:yes gene_type:complete